MSKESVFKEGSGSRKGFVSKFQTENNLDMQSENNISTILDQCIIFCQRYIIGRIYKKICPRIFLHNKCCQFFFT